MGYRLLIRFNHAPKGVMELFTSLLGDNNFIICRTGYGLVEIRSNSKAAYVCLLARMQNNKIQYREIKKEFLKKI